MSDYYWDYTRGKVLPDGSCSHGYQDYRQHCPHYHTDQCGNPIPRDWKPEANDVKGT